MMGVRADSYLRHREVPPCGTRLRPNGTGAATPFSPRVRIALSRGSGAARAPAQVVACGVEFGAFLRSQAADARLRDLVEQRIDFGHIP